jgi:hypothetical protein
MDEAEDDVARELAGKDAAIKVLMGENKELRAHLVEIANHHMSEYECACNLSSNTWQGDDQQGLRIRIHKREWAWVAKILLGDEYDANASPHHFPKNEDES